MRYPLPYEGISLPPNPAGHMITAYVYEVVNYSPVFVGNCGLADIHPLEDCIILVKDFLIHEKIIAKGEKINLVCVKKDRLI